MPRLTQSSCQLYAVSYAVKNEGGDCAAVCKKLHLGDFCSALDPPPTGQRRVLIIEDLDPSIIEVLGTAWDIDPVFFAGYIFTSFEDIEDSPAPPSNALSPSQVLFQPDWFHIHYQHIADLGQHSPMKFSSWVMKTSGNVKRAVRRLPPLRGRQLGIVRGCCSVLMKTFDQSSIGVILVDSTTSKVVKGSLSKSNATLGFRRIPLHGGIENFRRPVLFSMFQSVQTQHENNRDSFLKVLLDCFSENPVPIHSASPALLNLAYYPLRIVVGEWMLYSQVLARYLKHYEYSLDDIKIAIYQDEIMDLQKWRHRAIETHFKLQSTRDFISHLSTAERAAASWDLILKDFDYLLGKIDKYGQSLEQMIPVATSTIQLLDGRRSITQSVNVKRLTYLTIIFVPMSWVAAVFSMAGEFAPGQPKFWVYFAVSVPFSGVIVAWSLAMSLFDPK